MLGLKIDQIKSFLDSSIAFLGVIAAVIAVLSWYAGKKLDADKAVAEEKLKAQVSEANAEAEIAKREALRANESIAKTDLKTREVELKILNQKEKADLLSLELEAQREITAKAQIQLFQIKNKITPRSIPARFVNQFTEQLKDFEDKNIIIYVDSGDDETSFFAHNMMGIFKSAGWNVAIGTLFFSLKKNDLIISQYNNYPEAYKLQVALQNVGHNFLIREGDKPDKNEKVQQYINLLIGSR